MQGSNLDGGLTEGLLSILGETGSKVVFRSNITPDITIDVSGLMKTKAGKVAPSEEVPISSDDKMILKLIKPEVTLKALGSVINYAPYGHPRKEVALALLAGIIISGLIGARLAWAVCRRVS